MAKTATTTIDDLSDYLTFIDSFKCL